jgi:hypothetical protein
MDDPGIGTAIIRLSLISTCVLLICTGHGREGSAVALILVAWIAGPYARTQMIRLRQRGLQRRGDGWMADAARAKTADWRAYCRQQAARAYEQAREWDRVR